MEQVQNLDPALTAARCTHFKNKYGRIVDANPVLRRMYGELGLTPCPAPVEEQPEAPIDSVPADDSAPPQTNPLDDGDGESQPDLSLSVDDDTVSPDAKPAAAKKPAPAKRPSAAAKAKANQ